MYTATVTSNCYSIGIVDGSVVSRGEQIRVQYMGNVQWFRVKSLKPSTTSIGGYHDSLLFDMSNMSLDVDCPTDSIVVDTNTSCDGTQITGGCSTDYSDFFLVTLRTGIVIQGGVSSSNVVGCSYGKGIVFSILFLQCEITLDSITGMNKQVKLLREIVVIPLNAPGAFKNRGM